MVSGMSISRPPAAALSATEMDEEEVFLLVLELVLPVVLPVIVPVLEPEDPEPDMVAEPDAEPESEPEPDAEEPEADAVFAAEPVVSLSLFEFEADASLDTVFSADDAEAV